MKIGNVKIYTEDHEFEEGSVSIAGGKILEVVPGTDRSAAEKTEETGQDFVDGHGGYLIPGLVDMHFHGCMGKDFCDADPEGLKIMADYEASRGVTTICPASMTMSKDELLCIMKNAADYCSTWEKGGSSERAHFAGINMEGPFISPKNKGAQAEGNIIPCDVDFFRTLQAISGNRIKLVDIAPEEPGAMEFIDQLHKDVMISIAHTQADYETAREAFLRGASHVTHLFNAMPPLHHRRPGVIGAAADAGASVELICDGIHVHPSAVRAAFRLFGSENICMISDSMRAAGMADGKYTLGGQDVFVKGALATLEDGTIAGSVTNLMKCLKTAVQEMKIPLEDAVRCASENPAKAIGVFDRCGSVAAGKDADLVLLDHDLDVASVWVAGSRR